MAFFKKGIKAYEREAKKTLPSQGGACEPPKEETLLKAAKKKGGVSQAAGLLLLLGKEEASSVLKEMSDEEVEQVVAEISRIKKVGEEEALSILKDFSREVNLTGEGYGGVDQARQFLLYAFGEEKAQGILKKVFPGGTGGPFAFMNDLALPLILQLLKEEPVETCALVLSFLEAPKASAFLKSCDNKRQVELVKILAQKREYPPEVVGQVGTFLQEKAHNMGHEEVIEIDGKRSLTEILRHMDGALEQKILGELEREVPAISQDIRENLHTIDCVFQMRPRDLQDLLREMDDERLAFILRGKEERVKEHILGQLSSSRKLIVEETMILSPKVSRKEVEKETKALVELIRSRKEEGRYIFLEEDEEYL